MKCSFVDPELFKNWIDIDIKPPSKFRYYTFYVKRLPWNQSFFDVILGYYDGKNVRTFRPSTIAENCPYKPIAYKESEVQQYLEPFE